MFCTTAGLSKVKGNLQEQHGGLGPGRTTQRTTVVYIKAMMPSTPNTVKLNRRKETVDVLPSMRQAADAAVREGCLANCPPPDGDILGTGDF